MNLDKNHLNEFESIAPPMVNALTIPVEGTSVVIYVCSSPFAPATKAEVSAVAKRLQLVEDEEEAGLRI